MISINILILRMVITIFCGMIIFILITTTSTTTIMTMVSIISIATNASSPSVFQYFLASQRVPLNHKLR